jgi:hypothetical protein
MIRLRTKSTEFTFSFQFTQSLHAKIGAVTRGHDHFLPNPSQFTIQLSWHQTTPYSLVTDSLVKWGRILICRQDYGPNCSSWRRTLCSPEPSAHTSTCHILNKCTVLGCLTTWHQGYVAQNEQHKSQETAGGGFILSGNSVQKSPVLLDITPYSPLKFSRRFGGIYRLKLAAKQETSLKRWLAFNGLHGVIFPKLENFITTGVTTSNPATPRDIDATLSEILTTS